MPDWERADVLGEKMSACGYTYDPRKNIEAHLYTKKRKGMIPLKEVLREATPEFGVTFKMPPDRYVLACIVINRHEYGSMQGDRTIITSYLNTSEQFIQMEWDNIRTESPGFITVGLSPMTALSDFKRKVERIVDKLGEMYQ